MQPPDNVTPWFDSGTPPVHVGWYDTISIPPTSVHLEFPDIVEQMYFRKWWSGVDWRYSPHGGKCGIQHCWWRGRSRGV